MHGNAKTTTPHMMRDCKIHGRTDFTGVLTGASACLSWYCQECLRARGRKYQSELRAGIRMPKPRDSKKAVGDMCPRCFVELPIKGECGNCE